MNAGYIEEFGYPKEEYDAYLSTYFTETVEDAGYVNPYQELLEVINYWADDGKGNLDKSYFDAIVKAYGNRIFQRRDGSCLGRCAEESRRI
ncbi:MAG: hypothetical protein IJN54_07680 [Lachnospiraceae bacterium]|nr:hypothetical protein [Lachnospiraceae bacterium]